MKDFQKILEKIAKENGTTPEQVLLEMQQAIDEAYRNRNEKTKPMWDMLTYSTGRPTAETFVQQMAELLKEKDHPLQ